jgi:hypothetical protein
MHWRPKGETLAAQCVLRGHGDLGARAVLGSCGSSVASAHVYGDEQSGALHRVLVVGVHLALREVVPLAGLHLSESRQEGKLLWIQSGLYEGRGGKFVDDVFPCSFGMLRVMGHRAQAALEAQLAALLRSVDGHFWLRPKQASDGKNLLLGRALESKDVRVLCARLAILGTNWSSQADEKNNCDRDLLHGHPLACQA